MNISRCVHLSFYNMPWKICSPLNLSVSLVFYYQKILCTFYIWFECKLFQFAVRFDRETCLQGTLRWEDTLWSGDKRYLVIFILRSLPRRDTCLVGTHSLVYRGVPWRQVSLYRGVPWRQVLLYRGVPWRQVLLYRGVPWRQVSLYRGVPWRQVLLYRGVPWRQVSLYRGVPLKTGFTV